MSRAIDITRDIAVLGLNGNPTNTQIRKAYRTLALEYHPDKNRSQSASSRFIQIKAAQERLLAIDEDHRTGLILSYARPVFQNPWSMSFNSQSGFRTSGSSNADFASRNGIYQGSENPFAYGTTSYVRWEEAAYREREQREFAARYHRRRNQSTKMYEDLHADSRQYRDDCPEDCSPKCSDPAMAPGYGRPNPPRFQSSVGNRGKEAGAASTTQAAAEARRRSEEAFAAQEREQREKEAIATAERERRIKQLQEAAAYLEFRRLKAEERERERLQKEQEERQAEERRLQQDRDRAKKEFQELMGYFTNYLRIAEEYGMHFGDEKESRIRIWMDSRYHVESLWAQRSHLETSQQEFLAEGLQAIVNFDKTQRIAAEQLAATKEVARLAEQQRLIAEQEAEASRLTAQEEIRYQAILDADKRMIAKLAECDQHRRSAIASGFREISRRKQRFESERSLPIPKHKRQSEPSGIAKRARESDSMSPSGPNLDIPDPILVMKDAAQTNKKRSQLTPNRQEKLERLNTQFAAWWFWHGDSRYGGSTTDDFGYALPPTWGSQAINSMNAGGYYRMGLGALGRDQVDAQGDVVMTGF